MPGHRARRRRGTRVVGPGQLGEDRGRLVAVLGEHQLGDVALGPGPAAGDGTVGAAQVEHGHRLVCRRCSGRSAPAPPASRSGWASSSGIERVAPASPCRPDPPPMLTLSLPSVARATVHPPSTGPTTSSSGTNTSLKNTSLNSELAGRHLQRPHLDALGVHVDDHRGDAVVLRGVGVGAHGGEAALASVGAARPHLLAVDQPAAVDAGARGLDAGGVGAGVGLAEQLAPDDLLVERRAHPAGDLVVGGVLDQREDHPAGDAVRPGAGRRRRANSCSMTSCSTAPASRPHGCGQCGIDVAGVDQLRSRWASASRSCDARRRRRAPRRGSPRPRAAGRPIALAA